MTVTWTMSMMATLTARTTINYWEGGSDEYSYEFNSRVNFTYRVQESFNGSSWWGLSGLFSGNDNSLLECIFGGSAPVYTRLVEYGEASQLVGSISNVSIFGGLGMEKLQKVTEAIKSITGGILEIELNIPTPPLTGGVTAIAWPKGSSPTAANIKVLGVKVGVTASGDLLVSVPSSIIPGVSFSGTKYHQLKSDDVLTTYSAPHWFDENGDGDVVDEDDRNYPVAFTRNTKPKLGAKFEIGSFLSNEEIKIKATGPGGVAIPATDASISGTVATLEVTESSGAFVNTIKFYSAQESGKEFELTWEMKVGSNDWFEVGKSKHTVYLTLADPITSLRQETLFNLGSRRGDGKTNGSKTTIDSIYAEFTDQSVYKVQPGTGLEETQKMTYWLGGQVGCWDTAVFLARGDRNGNCQAWAGFFRDTLRVLGISADRKRVWRDPDTDVSNAENLTGIPSDLLERVGVKNWVFSGNGSSGDPSYPYTVGVDANDTIRIPAQGNPNSPRMFNGHWIVEAASTYYDPSYGSAAVINAGTSTGKIAYENAAFDGYFNYKVIQVGNNYTLGDQIMKKNNTSQREINMYNAN